MAIIKEISGDSIVRNKVKIGDNVVAMNGRPFIDLLDYNFAESMERGELTVERHGQTFSVPYRNKYGTGSFGLSFDESVEIVPRVCANNCVFCFVQQLPSRLRPSLYVKDDDYRLSFVCGSYITGTNLKEEDIRRILDYKLSPLYFSVHATDKEVQKYLLGVKKDFDQLALLRRFIDGGIRIHTQIVMVGGINDGDVLKKSLRDLYEIGAETVAVVPVGLTAYRENKPLLHPITPEQAANAIDLCEEFYKAHPQFCFCSDEMYQRANRPVPDASYYGSFDQIENGVGLIAKFFDDLDYALDDAPDALSGNVGLFTGYSGVSTMQKTKELLEARYPNLRLHIYPVRNDFFGASVTVTGLVTATDILAQYGERCTEDDFFMIPSVMLKEFENRFLDDITVEELSEKLKKKIVINTSSGDGFLEALIKETL